MTDRDIILNYYDSVIALRSIQRQLTWNQLHGLPEMNFPEQLKELKAELKRFEELLDRIQDRRTRVAMRCRYALGWNTRDIWTTRETSVFMDLDRNIISAITTAALRRINQGGSRQA